MRKKASNLIPPDAAPCGIGRVGHTPEVHSANTAFSFRHETADRPDAPADADKARRLLASLIARQIVSSVSPLSDNKEKTP
jgi:hypothetical protein